MQPTPPRVSPTSPTAPHSAAPHSAAPHSAPQQAAAPGRAGHLLDREAPADYRRDWTIRISQSENATAGASVSALVFRLGEEWLCLPTHVLQEVVRSFTIRSIPHRRGGTLLGLVNVRGELLLCVSLGGLLGTNQRSADPRHGPGDTERLLVLRHQDLHLAFPVDEVVGVHRYRPEEMLEAPATVARDGNGYTQSLFALEGRTVGCLDVDAVLAALERSLA